MDRRRSRASGRRAGRWAGRGDNRWHLNAGLLVLGTATALTLTPLALTAPARAGSVTAESIWDQRNAIQRAQSQLPAGATVTRTECTEVNVRTGNYRYICTVFYSDAPAPVSPSAPTAPSP